MQKLANNKGSWPPECVNQDCSDGLNQATLGRLPCFKCYCHDWPCCFYFVLFLYFYRQKKTRIKRVFGRGNMMNSSKCPLTPFRINLPISIGYVTQLVPQAHNFSWNDPTLWIWRRL